MRRMPSAWCNFILLAATLLALPLRAVELNWPGRGKILLDAPAQWELSANREGAAAISIKLLPPKPALGSLQIAVLASQGDKFVRVENLQSTLHDMVKDYIPNSVEKQFSPVALHSAQGTGWYAQFTDPALVGKSSTPDNLKVMRSALVGLTDHLLALVTMQFDDPDSPEAAAMLQVTESLRFVSLAASDLQISTDGHTYALRATGSKLTLEFPQAGLAQRDAGLGGGTANPRYFYFTGDRDGLVVSGWFEDGAKYRGLKTMWQEQTAAWEQNGVAAPTHEQFGTAGAWDYVAYDNELPHGHNVHLRAEHAAAGTWIDLHLSLTSDDDVDALRARLLDFLKQISVAADTP